MPARSRRTPRLAAFLLAALCMASHAAGLFDYRPDAAGEKALWSDFQIEAGTKVSYEDLNGKPVDFATFLAAIQASKSVSMMKNSADGSMVLKATKKPTADEIKAEEARRQAAYKVQPGQALPEFKLTGLDGAAYDKTSWSGRYTVLSFFFAACAPCIAEVPSLNKFKALHPELNVVALTFDKRDVAQKFRDKYKLDWPTLFESRPFNDMLGIHSYPSMVLLDPQGQVLGYKQFGKVPTPDEAAGSAEHAELAAWVKALAEKAAEKATQGG